MNGAMVAPLNRAAFNAWPIPARAGIGLRLPHHARVMEERHAADWLEVHPENYMSASLAARELDIIRRNHALSLHAVGLSLGSADGVSDEYLARLAGLILRYAPGLVSDHLSWSSIGGVHLPDLLPLPYTEETLKVVARNLDRAQTALKRPILIENPSTYFQVSLGSMSEPEFLGELVRRSGCTILLDINNIYVSAHNHGIDPATSLRAYLQALPALAIEEIHLAGHTVQRSDSGRDLRIDDHGSAVCSDVWRLYEKVITTIGARPTLIEWDNKIPDLEVLQAEAGKAQVILDQLWEEPRYALIG
jgi:uncharacterized protein (UPF0276 family)